MTTHTMEWARPPRRSTAFLLIVALHVLVIYAFLSVFVPPKATSPPPVIRWHMIDAVSYDEYFPKPKPLRFTPMAGQPVPLQVRFAGCLHTNRYGDPAAGRRATPVHLAVAW